LHSKPSLRTAADASCGWFEQLIQKKGNPNQDFPFSYPSTDKTLILSVYLFNKLPLNLPLQKVHSFFLQTRSVGFNPPSLLLSSFQTGLLAKRLPV
jgi:hypothetical protein